MYESSEDSGETARMRGLAKAFTARKHVIRNQNLMYWLIYTISTCLVMHAHGACVCDFGTYDMRKILFLSLCMGALLEVVCLEWGYHTSVTVTVL